MAQSTGSHTSNNNSCTLLSLLQSTLDNLSHLTPTSVLWSWDTHHYWSYQFEFEDVDPIPVQLTAEVAEMSYIRGFIRGHNLSHFISVSLETPLREAVVERNGRVRQTVVMILLCFGFFFLEHIHHFSNLIHFWVVETIPKWPIALLGSFSFLLSSLISVEVHKVIRTERQRKKTVVGLFCPSPNFKLQN